MCTVYICRFLICLIVVCSVLFTEAFASGCGSQFNWTMISGHRYDCQTTWLGSLSCHTLGGRDGPSEVYLHINNSPVSPDNNKGKGIRLDCGYNNQGASPPACATCYSANYLTMLPSCPAFKKVTGGGGYLCLKNKNEGDYVICGPSTQPNGQILTHLAHYDNGSYHRGATCETGYTGESSCTLCLGQGY